jgi:rhodanese-related sulfurtransferase
MNKNRLLLLAICLLVLPFSIPADEVKGRIKYISNKANTIQIDVKGKEPVVVRFDAKTVFDGASGIKDLGPPDLIKVTFEPGKPATKIAKIVFGLPPGVEIDMNEMLATLQGQRGPYFLGDARPKKRYLPGHIPSAVAFPIQKNPESQLAKLPADKSHLIVFYCGGPTCPYTGKAVELAAKAGYTNLKGFQAGIPAWKKSKLPVHANAEWLSKNLDIHHIVIDVRSPEAAGLVHLPGAVSLTTGKLQEMTREFIKTGKEARLPGVTDKSAPIFLYSDKHTDPQVILAFKEIRSWGYKNTAILEGGLEAWTAAGLPTSSGKLATTIEYEKKLAKGAIPPTEFAKLEKSRQNVVFVDVRSDAEVAKEGKLKGAVHIPLDALESRLADLPKDKEIVTYCENGIRAEMAYEALKDKGYQVKFLNETIEFDEQGNYTL